MAFFVSDWHSAFFSFPASCRAVSFLYIPVSSPRLFFFKPPGLCQQRNRSQELTIEDNDRRNVLFIEFKHQI